jgi:hypothetical protein
VVARNYNVNSCAEVMANSMRYANNMTFYNTEVNKGNSLFREGFGFSGFTLDWNSLWSIPDYTIDNTRLSRSKLSSTYNLESPDVMEVASLNIDWVVWPYIGHIAIKHLLICLLRSYLFNQDLPFLGGEVNLEKIRKQTYGKEWMYKYVFPHARVVEIDGERLWINGFGSFQKIFGNESKRHFMALMTSNAIRRR